MRTIRSFTKKPLTILVLLIAFLNLSCNKDDAVTQNEINKKYNGEEMIRGLFFFQNEISDDVSFLKDFKSQLFNSNQRDKVLNELKDISDVSINYIKSHNPEFISEFENAMYSSNYYLIQQKLDECAILIGNSLALSDKYSDAFQFAQELQDSPKFMKFISSTDLSTIEGQTKLNEFLNENPEFQYDENGLKVAIPIFVGAVAVVYVAAGAVSIAVALYSVVTKAAYWDPIGFGRSAEETLNKEIIVSELGNYFSSN